jgi:single-strand DNA-binding protein
MRVIVQGRLKQRSYEDKEQVKRTVYELDVEEVGASLKNATAKVTKTTATRERPAESAAAGAPAGRAAGQWPIGTQQGGYSDEPPF